MTGKSSKVPASVVTAPPAPAGASAPASSPWISLPPYSTEPGSGPSPGAISATVVGSTGCCD